MLGVRFIFVGRAREPFWRDACAEYEKRLGAFCRPEICEVAERRLPDSPSASEIAAALEREGEDILRLVPRGAWAAALCVEGRRLSSPALAALLADTAGSGTSKLCFIVGGSYGLGENVKRACAQRLSLSDMTFPHALARVMLMEQVYRAFSISAGSKYHK